MTYKELYEAVIASTEYSGRIAKIKALAQLVYSRNYQEQVIEDKKEAGYLALELYEEMTGNWFDPTQDEFEDIVNSII